MKKPIKNVFTIPSTEAKQYLSAIVEDVHTVLKNDNFMEATKRVKLPDNATMKDYERAVKDAVPSKISNFMNLFVNDCYENIVRILCNIFVTPYEEYSKKSLDDMCKDIYSLNINQISRLLSFFLH